MSLLDWLRRRLGGATPLDPAPIVADVPSPAGGHAPSVPGLGPMTQEDDWLCSEPVAVAMFGGARVRFMLEGYEEDDHRQDFDAAIAAFLNADSSVLAEASEALFQYYKDFEDDWLDETGEEPLERARDAWQLVAVGEEAVVSRRSENDRSVYISLECECDWEPEHGLQLVFRDGRKVTKLGGYDGHLSNADAFDDESLENVIYCRTDDG